LKTTVSEASLAAFRIMTSSKSFVDYDLVLCLDILLSFIIQHFLLYIQTFLIKVVLSIMTFTRFSQFCYVVFNSHKLNAIYSLFKSSNGVSTYIFELYTGGQSCASRCRTPYGARCAHFPSDITTRCMRKDVMS
jgi:hypothetical protein